MTKQILLVEDQIDIAENIVLHLTDHHFQVKHVIEGQLAICTMQQQVYDLVILDLVLPDMDGLEICRRIRSLEIYMPILMLSSKASELERVLGLEMGADDYLTKPFSMLELLARVKAIFRRIEALKDPVEQEILEAINYKSLSIYSSKREVYLKKRLLNLTAKEFDLLIFFAKNPGKVFTRSDLLDAVWGYSYNGYEHTVNSHINRLRSKIEEDITNPEYIQTVWGVGYKFSE